MATLRDQVASGLRWTTFGTFFTAIVGPIQIVVTSRLLEPREIGLSAMAWVLLGFLQLFSDAGIGNAIIYRQESTSRELSSVYWLNFGLGCIISLLILASAPLQGAFYREPALIPVVAALSPIFAVMAIGQPFEMLARRDMLFKSISFSNFFAALTSIALCIAFALAGFGVYSLVIAGLGSTAAKSFYLIYAVRRTWLPSLHFRRDDLGPFLNFGAYQLLDRLGAYMWNNADYLFVGRVIGPAGLAVYRLARELSVRPVGIVGSVVNSVAFPALARKQGDAETMRKVILDMTLFVSLVSFPIFFVLAAAAPVIIPGIFGPEWNEGIVPLRIMSAVGALRMLGNIMSNVILARGLVKLGAILNVGHGLIALGIHAWAAHYGIVFVSWAVLIIYLVFLAVSWKWIYADGIQLQLSPWLRMVWRSTLVAGPLALLAWLMTISAPLAHLPLVKSGLIAAFAGVGFVVMVRVLEWDFARKNIALLTRRSS